jgi:hypothetical protein
MVSCLDYSVRNMEALRSSETSLDFRRTKRRYNPSSACRLVNACFLFGLFNPEDGGDTFLRNVGGLIPKYMELQPRFCLPLVYCWFLAWFKLRLWRWRRYVPPESRLNFTGLHGVTSQHTERTPPSLTAFVSDVPLCADTRLETNFLFTMFVYSKCSL